MSILFQASIFLNETIQNDYRLHLNLWKHITHDAPEENVKRDNAIGKVKQNIKTLLKTYEIMLSDKKIKNISPKIASCSVKL